MTRFEAVLFDWRGTLAMMPKRIDWAREALRRLGRDDGEQAAAAVLDLVRGAPELAALQAPGLDSDAARHHRTYLDVLTGAGIDRELVDALYEVESDIDFNPFARTVPAVLAAVRAAGIRVAVVSDVHVDLRPAFGRAGLGELVDVFALSFEHGVEKPHRELFEAALTGLGLPPERVLMVGDRAGHDGAAVELGIVTLLLPSLRSVDDDRLTLVLSLLGVSADTGVLRS